MNNPVNMSDPSGCWPKWISNLCNNIKKIAQNVWNVVSSTAANIAVGFIEIGIIISY
jgi:hypothetical protein